MVDKPYGQRGKIDLPPLRRNAAGETLCTWCDTPVKPPRKTWCSSKCVDEWRERGDWNHIRNQIIKRDKVCRMCGSQRLRRVYDVKADNANPYWGRAHPRDAAWPVEYVPPYTVCSPGGWEVDHIVAVEQGGTDDPANLRLLCSPCHLDVTRAQRRAKALERRRQLPLIGETK